MISKTSSEFVFLEAVQEESFDYIIIGAGAAGLMLADAMGEDPHFARKSILLLERQEQRTNDRTWSYWEKGKGNYDAILLHKWRSIRFKDEGTTLIRDIGPYAYKTIRAMDFYSYHEKRTNDYPNLKKRRAAVQGFNEDEKGVTVKTDIGLFRGDHIFSSVQLDDLWQKEKKYPVLQQHFIGWYIQSEEAIFNPETATFMDFSVSQKGNTRFMYVLPTSAHSGLVEYTLFSKDLLEKAEYETAIQKYIKEDLNCDGYTITEKEMGSIPMTAYDFSRHNTHRITHIGTAGGWTKPSTGFTFNNTRKNTIKLLENIKNNSRPFGIKQAKRHRIYDTLLLDILSITNEKGGEIFSAMFRKRPAQAILSFLDEETNLKQELNMIWACPKMPFLRALWKRIF